jgi:hypothetical protein
MKTKKSAKRLRIEARCEAHEEELMLLEGPEYDVAILGIVTGKGMTPKILYSTKKVIEMLKKQGIKDGLHEDQAVEAALEWFSVNTSDAYMGPNTPCFLEDAW